MSILVIGTGAIGQRHADNLRDLGEGVSVYSWREGGIDGLRRLLDQTEFEAAIVCTATNIRLDVLKLTSSLGLPVYLEKPVAFKCADLAAITHCLGPLAERSFAGFMMRYHPALRFLADKDLKGQFRFDFEIGHDVHQWRQNWIFAQSYAAKPEGGGVLLDLCHELDMALTLFPDAKLTTVTSLDHCDHPRVDFATSINLITEAASGTVSMDYLSPASKRTIRLRGRDACFDLDLVKNTFYISDAHDERKMDGLSIDRQEMFKDTMRDFLRLIRGLHLENPLAPVLSKCAKSNDMICRAWEARRFIGTIGGDR
ncbi:MAG: hypothetical protein AAF198_09930 [Pseudomonadota bacterium]